jgi:TonB family protein
LLGLLLACLCLTKSATFLHAEIPLACTPPTITGYAPPVFPVSFGPPGEQRSFWIGAYVDKEGNVADHLSNHLPAEVRPALIDFLQKSTWRPAHDLTAPSWGFRRQRVVAYLAPVEGAPTPQPQFQLNEAAREKLEAVARTAVKGWLRLRLQVGRNGSLERVHTTNETLGDIISDIFREMPGDQPPFVPATENGRGVAGLIDLWWDLTLPSDREDFANAETNLVEPGANSFPGVWDGESETREARAWLFPTPNNVVAGIFLEASLEAPLALPLLQRFSGWFIPPRNVRFPLEVSLTLRPPEQVVVVGAFRSVEETSTSLTMSARPIYPKRRFLPDPDGFVRFAFTVGTDGLIEEWSILEASSERFRRPALEALAEWRFNPRLFDGQPVPARIFYTMPFRADRDNRR